VTIPHPAQRTLVARTVPRVPSHFLTDFPADAIEVQGLSKRHGINALPYPRSAGYAEPSDDSLFADAEYGSPAYSRGGGGRSGTTARGSRWQDLRANINGARARASGPSKDPSPDGRWVDREAFDDVDPDEHPLRNVLPGSRVHHERFGKGVVREIKPEEPPRIVADFGGFGVRTVLANKLSLAR